MDQSFIAITIMQTSENTCSHYMCTDKFNWPTTMENPYREQEQYYKYILFMSLSIHLIIKATYCIIQMEFIMVMTCGDDMIDGVHMVMTDGVHMMLTDGIHMVMTDGVHMVMTDGVHMMLTDGIHMVMIDGVHMVMTDGVHMVMIW